MKNYIQKVAWALVLLLAATLSLSAKDGTAVRKLFKKGVSDSISVGGSKLVVLQKDLIRNRSLSVNSIGEENVPELDCAMRRTGLPFSPSRNTLHRRGRDCQDKV